MPSVSASQDETTTAPFSCAAAASGATSSTAPRKFGCETKTAEVSSSIAWAQASASVTPSRSGTSVTVVP